MRRIIRSSVSWPGLGLRLGMLEQMQAGLNKTRIQPLTARDLLNFLQLRIE